jgi:hypothetical protein
MRIQQLRRLGNLLTFVFIVGVAAVPAAYLSAQTVDELTPATPETIPLEETPSPAPGPAPAPEPVPPPAPTPGPTQPTGPERSSYVLNTETGKWENDKYIWDPVTKKTAPKTPTNYSYNPETGKWDTTVWQYDAPTGKYVENTVSVAVPPAGAPLSDPSGTAPSSFAARLEESAANGNNLQNGANNDLQGPDSQNAVDDENDTNGFFDLFHNSAISNTINSLAQSGNALIGNNTLGGNAITGNALAMANILNMLNTSWNPLGGRLVTFVKDIVGDVVGDLLIDPAAIVGQNPATSSAGAPDNVEINAEVNNSITNDVNLNAQSGNADVVNNTTGGDATTGNAYAVANIVNAINSLIAAQDSFMGVINIHGNLDGDILLPPELLNELLTSNAVGTLDTSQIENGSLLANFTDNTDIANNVNASAESGKSTVAHNTTGGNATSGNADTNVAILNLTGKQVVGSNSMLVFVNVFGKWVGLIMDAPEGATAAALGGNTQTSALLPGNTEINSETNNSIVNNLNLNALTGDATVKDNTTGGNATSGDALAAANIANIVNSQFSLSNWFGVLFINVFGNWNGSFNVDTEAGEVPETAAPAQESVANVPQIFRFVPGSSGKPKVEPAYNTWFSAGGYTEETVSTDEDNVVLGTTTENKSSSGGGSSSTTPAPSYLMQIIGGAIAFTLLGVERAIKKREMHMARLHLQYK